MSPTQAALGLFWLLGEAISLTKSNLFRIKKKDKDNSGSYKGLRRESSKAECYLKEGSLLFPAY